MSGIIGQKFVLALTILSTHPWEDMLLLTRCNNPYDVIINNNKGVVNNSGWGLAEIGEHKIFWRT